MKYLFHLGHPAHYHLFKNLIIHLNNNNHECRVVIKKKDVLEDLLKSSNIEYVNILPDGRKDGILNIAIGQLKQAFKLYWFCVKFKPQLLIGSTPTISQVGKLMSIDSINLVEDDAEAISLYANTAYPWASCILAPNVCSVGKFVNKKIGYESYHELAYLHPKNFSPSLEIASKYVNTDKPFFIVRFAKLTAYHDDGVEGISNILAKKIINEFEKYGKVYITSERKLDSEFEKYRIKIDPKDMHHVMNYASFFIGDSQTMAAEAAVLGVPFIRINDFVGRLSYLEELEKKYKLGFGFLPNDTNDVVSLIGELLNTENLKEEFKKRKERMLSEKIDYNAFLVWFIENYPQSIQIMKDNPDYQFNFK
jgi:uncharacterized protein